MLLHEIPGWYHARNSPAQRALFPKGLVMRMEEKPNQSPTSSSERPMSPYELEQREAQARDIVGKHVLWSLGAGIIPVPLVDVAALTAINLRLLRTLADHYNVPFSDHVGKSIVSSLLGSVSGAYLGRYLVYTILKSVPIVGSVAGLASVSLAAGALTHAMGRLFTQHFETGGTLLSFDAKAMRKHFLNEFEASREKVASMHQTPPQPPA
ncbi:YcjF family protein [Archangium sp.]|uniref:YcjF family protein n=1 Tax=Archangium sp. TaxID=1872627 RepID=UPI002D4C6E4B|nr:DUF697 domain-containing protein [Archangium sp.]HYO58568.1 DUF697 domain-containing protein [Archangium sp.]